MSFTQKLDNTAFPFLLHHLLLRSAARTPDAACLIHGETRITYGELAAGALRFARALRALGFERGDRIGIFLDKRPENIAAVFGASLADCVFVPVNPVLKARQIEHICADCGISALVTTPERLAMLDSAGVTGALPAVRLHVLAGAARVPHAPPAGTRTLAWDDFLAQGAAALEQDIPPARNIDTDVAAIFYTSGSTGRSKGVVLSHRNLVLGASSVATYLGNHPGDTLLAALPLSFDAGFSQITTAFHAGACVVLQNYLLPHEVREAVIRHQVTGLTGVPPLWIPLSRLEWPASVTGHLRYFANTGGKMPVEVFRELRKAFPRTKPYLMYGLTEAFRATYLPPEQADLRPDSIGRAIPDTEIRGLREDGTPCDPGEPGELVQRGGLVAQGYWNNPEATAERFKPLPPRATGRLPGVLLPEIAVYSGDIVRRDREGYLYFVGRRDEMIKTSGYRVSPVEVEEVLYEHPAIAECAAFGVAHETLGQVIHVVAALRPTDPVDTAALLEFCRRRMPNYMVPARIELRDAPLPRNANGKIDRALLAGRAS